jgi:hypothetical protein
VEETNLTKQWYNLKIYGQGRISDERIMIMLVYHLVCKRNSLSSMRIDHLILRSRLEELREDVSEFLEIADLVLGDLR